MSNKVTTRDLTPRQVKAAVLEASPESWELTQSEKAKQLKIAHTTLGRWQKLPVYREYVGQLIKQHAERMLPYAWHCLKERMKVDTQALKLYFTVMGEYKQRHEVTGEGGGPVRLAVLAAYSEKQLEQLKEELQNDMKEKPANGLCK